MAWRIEGTYFESCSCELICPCIAGFFLAHAATSASVERKAFAAIAAGLAAKG